MAKISGNVLTEKGVLKARVRNAIADKEIKAFENNNLLNYSKTEKGAIMFKEYVDESGNKVYATYTLTISLTNPNKATTKSNKAKLDDSFLTEE